MLPSSPSTPSWRALACKARCWQRGVAHLVFPDEVQALRAAMRRGLLAGEGGWPTRDRAARPEALDDSDRRSWPEAQRPVIIAGPGARERHAPRRSRSPTRSARRYHDLPRQGPDPRRPPAGLRRARAQRHPGGELDHERGGPAASCSAPRSPATRHLPGPPDHEVNLDPCSSASFDPVEVPCAGERSAPRRSHVRRAAGQREAGRHDPGAPPTSRLARRSGTPEKANRARR